MILLAQESLPAKSKECVVAAMGEGKSIDKNSKEIKLCR
jgi:hypothetical protein